MNRLHLWRRHSSMQYKFGRHARPKWPCIPCGPESRCGSLLIQKGGAMIPYGTMSIFYLFSIKRLYLLLEGLLLFISIASDISEFFFFLTNVFDVISILFSLSVSRIIFFIRNSLELSILWNGI